MRDFALRAECAALRPSPVFRSADRETAGLTTRRWPVPSGRKKPAGGPVLVFLDCAAGCEAVSSHALATETIIAPVTGSVDAAGTTLAQGDVRLEEADVEHPALAAGPDGAQVVIIFAEIELHPVDLAGEPAVARCVVRGDRGTGLVADVGRLVGGEDQRRGGVDPGRCPLRSGINAFG